METKQIIYAVTSGSDYKIHTAKYYSTKELAQKALKEIAKDRKFRPGVNHIEETEDTFSFIFGWEEAKVTFRIIPVPIEE